MTGPTCSGASFAICRRRLFGDLLVCLNVGVFHFQVVSRLLEALAAAISLLVERFPAPAIHPDNSRTFSVVSSFQYAASYRSSHKLPIEIGDPAFPQRHQD